MSETWRVDGNWELLLLFRFADNHGYFNAKCSNRLKEEKQYMHCETVSGQ